MSKETKKKTKKKTTTTTLKYTKTKQLKDANLRQQQQKQRMASERADAAVTSLAPTGRNWQFAQRTLAYPNTRMNG